MTSLILATLVAAQAPDLGKAPDVMAQVRAFRELPANVRAASIVQARPDEKGLVGYNQKQGWNDVGVQRTMSQSLTMAIADENHAAAAKMLDGIKKTFKMMNPDGSWQVNKPNVAKVPKSEFVSGNAFWLKDTVPALMQLKAWDARYAKDVDALTGDVAKAAKYLYDGHQLLIRRDARAANRTFMDARALISSGYFLKNQEYVNAGRMFLKRGLDMQMPEGYYLEEGGSDTSYQSVSLRELAGVYLYEPTPELKASMRKGADWYLNTFLPDGRIDISRNSRTGVGKETAFGQPKLGNHPVGVSVALATIAGIFPESKAASISKEFVKIAFVGQRQKDPREYMVR